MRFKPTGFFATGAAAGAASSSSSSSASLSEVDEEEDGEGERTDFWSLVFFGASVISISESLASLSELELELDPEAELLSLSESLLELAEGLEVDAVFSHVLKISNRAGAFLTSVWVLRAFNSFARAVLVAVKPLEDRKAEMAASNCGGTTDLPSVD